MPASSLSKHEIDVRPVEFGWLAVAVRGGRLLSVVYGHDTPVQAERALDHQRIATAAWQGLPNDEQTAADWAERIEAYCRGDKDRLIDIVLADDHLTPFAREVTNRCRQIPSGQTVTYGELAAECGRPRAARAVGSVMARNPWPLVVPCHRVVGANGGLGGYSAPQGLDMKRRLLALEGVDLSG